MKITKDGLPRVRCDGCGAYQGTTEFSPFYVSTPLGLHKITREAGEMPLYEPGSNLPRQYHSCPNCAKKIRASAKSHRPESLPDGWFKRDIMAAIARRRSPRGTFILRYVRDSAMGMANT